ncbi:glycerol-3-phosphate acyltransferase, partial [Cohnella sp. GbtcB17]|uniref:glycerol-3-phosphate acyltransferase n=1 Tax=Cohnella sp. GbtcB17 TaxID=2824762 RepID=UPI001C2F64EC
ASLLPVLGHAFSPFLRGRGGIAIATTFGVWCALSFVGALAYAVILAILLLGGRLSRGTKKESAEADALQGVLGMLLLFVYALARAVPA